MKKIFAIAALGVIALSCTKKNDHALQDSNTMLEEPAAPAVVADTTKKATDNTAVATPATTAEPVATPATAPAQDHSSGNTNAANSTGSSGGTPNGAPQKGTPAGITDKK